VRCAYANHKTIWTPSRSNHKTQKKNNPLRSAKAETAEGHTTMKNCEGPKKTQSDPLVKGHTPVHHLTSLQSATVLFLFILLSLSLLLSDTASALLPFPHLTPVVAGQALTSRLLLSPAAGAWSWTVDLGSSLQNFRSSLLFFLFVFSSLTLFLSTCFFYQYLSTCYLLVL
jgi:hypothetical protein